MNHTASALSESVGSRLRGLPTPKALEDICRGRNIDDFERNDGQPLPFHAPCEALKERKALLDGSWRFFLLADLWGLLWPCQH